MYALYEPKNQYSDLTKFSITSKKGLLDFFKAGRGALLPSIYANSNEMQNQFDIEGTVW